VQIWREGAQAVAQTMPIDVVSSGPRADSARPASEEAVHLLLFTAQSAGTLQEVLEEYSYELQEGVWRAPEWAATAIGIMASFPLFLLAPDGAAAKPAGPLTSLTAAESPRRPIGVLLGRPASGRGK